MIDLGDFIPVGKIAKTHGIKGEMNVEFSIDTDLDACDFFVMEMDGIPVPFFIDTYRYRNDTVALVSFEGVETEPAARKFFGKTVYVRPEYTDEDSDNINTLIGYTLITTDNRHIGKITDIDDTTANILLTVDDKLIPAAAIEITERDDKHKTLTVSLPDGLLEI